MSQWPTTIVQDDINVYAEVSHDFNPIHVDPEFARTTPYGSTIAHGCIVGAVVTRYMVEDLGLKDRLTGVRLKFIGAVRSGDSLRCGAERAADEDKPGQITYKVSCTNQNNDTVAVGTATARQESR
jgi:3-hydroxybutyryl-CoA dehydratase